MEMKMRKTLYKIGLVGVLAVTACGGGSTDPFDDPNFKGGDSGGSGPALTATLKGKIAFEGTAPTPKKIQTSADPGCMNPGLVSEETVVSDGGLENVIIYVSGGLEGMSFSTPREVVTLDQHGCQYVPHAITLMTGQELLIRNSDETAHNVHAWAEVNPPFNESQASKGLETRKKFDKEEIMLPIRCDVHNWMNAFVGVFKHPLSTVSKTGGAFEMKLPAGSYEITAIHEKLGKQSQKVDVAENGTVELNFTFKAS
jgi:hypothetical protein